MYTITISKKGQRIEMRGKEWTTLSKAADGSEQRGYTPEIDKTVNFDEEIFKQSIDELDMPAVIRAINGMK